MNQLQLQLIVAQLKMQENKIDYFKYKSATFFIFIGNVIIAFLGPIFFRNLYFIFTALCLTYTLLKYTQMIFIFTYVFYRFEQAMHSFKKRQLSAHKFLKEINNVYIIPNFNENEELLKESILNLASHERAKDYCLFLAMEKHEANSTEKAKKLIKQHSSHFRLMSYTVHQLQPGESKSKASNINWCGIYMKQKLIENYVNLDTTMITVMDSDSLIPEAYIDQVERHIEQNYDKRHTFVYQPPQIFTKNQRNAAFFVRVIDNIMSWIHVANLYSIFNYTMGVSNYTLSYRLLERIGFWDTCIYSKGEDIRIISKALWKTDGQAKSCPIYVPINQLHLTTNQGILADFKARFHQAKRHSEDQIEMSYNLANSLHAKKISLLRRIHSVFSLFEVYVPLIIVPLPFLVLILQEILGVLPQATLDTGGWFIAYNNVNLVIVGISFSLHYIFKKRASMALFGIQPLNFCYALQTPLLQIPIALIFGFVPMVVASYNLLRDIVTFSVTPKGNSLSTSDVFSNPQEQSFVQSEHIRKDKASDTLPNELPSTA